MKRETKAELVARGREAFNRAGGVMLTGQGWLSRTDLRRLEKGGHVRTELKRLDSGTLVRLWFWKGEMK